MFRIAALIMLLGELFGSAAAVAQPPAGEHFVLKTAYGTTLNAYLVGPEQSSAAVLLLHDRWGFDEAVQLRADKLAAEGFLTLAVDLFDGRRPRPFDGAHADDITRTIDPQWISANVKAALDFLNADPDRKTAVIGWGYGGTQALRASFSVPYAVISAVMVYGDVIMDEDALDAIRGPVLAVFARQDERIGAGRVREFEAMMRRLQNPVVVRWIPGEHGFADEGTPAFNAAASDQAWRMAMEFLNDTVR